MATLDLEGAAKRLNIHPDTLAKRVRRGEVPGAKIGRAWAFDEAMLDAMLQAEITRQTEMRKFAANLVATMKHTPPGRPRRARRILPELPKPLCPPKGT